MSRCSGYLDYLGSAGLVFPTGSIMPAVNGVLNSPDWLICNGASYAKTAYPNLALNLGDNYTYTTGTLPVAPSSVLSGATGAGLFVFTCYNSSVAMTSPDGVTWTQRTLPVSSTWISCAWSGSVFCAVTSAAGGSTVAATSPDGITWTQQTLPTGIVSAQSVVWANSQFIVIGNGSTYATSPDGVTWTSRTLPVSMNVSNLAYNGTTVLFTSSAASTSAVVTSTDGVNWTQRTLPASGAWASVLWTGTQFIAQTSASLVGATSPDGTTWTRRPMPTGYIVATSDNLLLSISASYYSTSADAITWRQWPTSFASTRRIAFWTGTQFSVVPNASPFFLVSRDTTTFAVPTVPTGVGGFCSGYTGNYYIKT